MDTLSNDELALSAKAADAPRASGTARTRLLELARAVRQVYLQVLGIPDYERYAAHMALHHPGEPMLTQRQFFAWAMDRKYRRGGQRCC
jgi:uncharacterized short protein YbdD (DUF466 family)